jgi:hypothetical protein
VKEVIFFPFAETVKLTEVLLDPVETPRYVPLAGGLLAPCAIVAPNRPSRQLSRSAEVAAQLAR